MKILKNIAAVITAFVTFGVTSSIMWSLMNEFLIPQLDLHSIPGMMLLIFISLAIVGIGLCMAIMAMRYVIGSEK